MTFQQSISIFRIFDFNKTEEFYIHFLGFKVDWRHQFEPDFPLYLQISKDGCIIHLSEHFGDASPGASIRIHTENVEKYAQQLLDKNYKHCRPGVEKKPWGNIEMTIHDPFGNKLIFYSAKEMG